MIEAKYRLLIRAALAVVLLGALSQTAHAIPFSFESRSLGMGGVSTATADLGTAAWANPAMLTNQPVEDDWSLLIGLGGFVRDDDDLITDIDDFQDADDRRRNATNPIDEAAALAEMRSIIGGIENKAIAPEATALFAMGIAFESFSMAVSVRSDAIAGGIMTNLSCDPSQSGCDPNEILSDEFNILNVDGVLATEIGISFATAFKLWDRKFSIGIKPKLVEVDVFSESESILTISSDYDFAVNRDNRQNKGTFETIDLGLALDLSDSVRLGLNVRNLLTEEFKVFEQTLNFDTQARFGVAYYNDFIVLALDYDLTENEPLLPNESFGGLRTQYVMVGAEFHGLRYVKFRLGARQNVASDISAGAKDPLYTAGVGFWLGFNLDVAAIYNEHTAGVFLQSGFQF